MLGYFDEAQKVIPSDQFGHEVWISGSKYAENEQAVTKTGFILVVACMDTPFRYGDPSIQHLRFPIEDNDQCDIKAYFEPALEVIDTARASGKVLVYSKLGISRCSTILIAYLMQKYNKKWRQAYQAVKAHRLCAEPRQAFLKQLQWYQKFRLGRL